MAGLRRTFNLASAVLIIGAAPSAYAQWWEYSYYGPVHYSPTFYTYPPYPICNTAPSRTPTSSPAPKTAPKSAIKIPTSPTKEPPAQAEPFRKGPIVTESRAQAGGYAEVKDATGRCKVGFWNLTGRDVTLTIAGKRQTLPKDRAVTLELDRTFNWHLDEREAVMERVPEGETFHEVILRE